MNGIVEVSAAVIERPDGHFLMASRPAGKAYAGWWEFPGGKVEPGETPHQALARELREELGLAVRLAYPWIVREYVYPHAHVRLHFFRVVDWAGEPHPHEGQQLAWTRAESPAVEPILPANGPILKGLSLPLVYAVSDLATLGEARFLARLEAALDAGLKLVQLREKALDASALASLAQAMSARCRAHGALLILNSDQPDALLLARRLGAGLHLTGDQLARAETRPDLEWAGASCHDGDELDRAAALGLDYALVSPVLPTASHPGAPSLGWDRFARLVAGRSLPVYALGGLDAGDLDQARRHGAHGVALKRGAWNGPAG